MADTSVVATQLTAEDPIQIALQKLLDGGKKRGYVTWEEMNELLPDEAIAPVASESRGIIRIMANLLVFLRIIFYLQHVRAFWGVRRAHECMGLIVDLSCHSDGANVHLV